ncbi:MAG: hypothetical protein J2P35_07070 [Actinobacteria bacterium]|nr:hypothetical protein [Actinomycetota bacterium]MBO0788451.1 hypothetical protein [Actinomycetota bacterium]
MGDGEIRLRLAGELRKAVAARDLIAVSALRSALAAIDNAGAVPLSPGPAAGTSSPHVAGAAAGLGAGEAERRRLSDSDAAEIVRAEAADRRAVAGDYDRSGHTERAWRLRREADVLEAALAAGGPA